jgi:hypothetical protein
LAKNKLIFISEIIIFIIKNNIMSKALFYAHDGSGRDTYIGFNSGGFQRIPKPLFLSENPNAKNISTYMSFNLKTARLSNFAILPQRHKYCGDGTGRDSYVMKNGGGSTKDNKSRSQLLHEYAKTKILYEKNKSRGMGLSLADTFSVPRIPAAHQPNFRLRKNISMGNLNGTTRSKAGDSPVVAKTELTRNRIKPQIMQRRVNLRGSRNQVLSMDSMAFESITTKHGSKPFFNIRGC